MRICRDVKVRHLVKVGFSFVFAFMIISLPLATKRRFFPVFVSIVLFYIDIFGSSSHFYIKE